VNRNVTAASVPTVLRCSRCGVSRTACAKARRTRTCPPQQLRRLPRRPRGVL